MRPLVSFSGRACSIHSNLRYFFRLDIVVVVQKVKGDGPTRYAISVSTKFGVEPHLPALPHPAIFEKSEKLRDILLYKCINAERTAMLSPEFRSKMMRSRKEFLKLMYQSYATKK